MLSGFNCLWTAGRRTPGRLAFRPERPNIPGVSRGITSAAVGLHFRQGPALAACLLAGLLCACEVHKPADTAALGQTDAATPSAAPDLLGGPPRPARSAAYDTGFVLLGGPVHAARATPAAFDPSAARRPAIGDGDGDGQVAISTPSLSDPEAGAMIWGNGAPRAAAPRGPAAVTSPDPMARAAPLETELLTPPGLHLDTSSPPTAASSSGLQVDGGTDVFGRVFSFMLCMLTAAGIWRWRRAALQRQAAEAQSVDA